MQHVVGIGWLVAASVVHDITPHLEHPQPPHQLLVDGALGEVMEVVQIAAEPTRR